jgi:Family of unknown function (DUF6526)
MQNYKNHIRHYHPHHFIFYPLCFLALLSSLAGAYFDAFSRLVWIAIAIVFVFITGLSFMMRQHYALINQDRIIRLELRFRYYVLTQKRFEELESKISPGQLYALRFASDAELIGLTERAMKENLSPDEIKKSIINWVPDLMRA